MKHARPRQSSDPFCAIPEPLRIRPQWVVWKKEFRDGHPIKIPYCVGNPTHRTAVDDPTTWGSYEEAVATFELWEDVDGIGFVFTKDDPYCGIDLDQCRNPETGELESWAQEIIQALNSYTEVSPSGRGVHIIVEGALPPGGRRKGQVEMYDDRRYFCMTGNLLNGAPGEADDAQ